jgi:hypothetical protein
MSGPGLARWDSGEHVARPGGGSSGLRRIPAALLLALLAALAIAGSAQAAASSSAGDPACEQGSCVVYHAPPPWLLPGGDTLITYRGWPVRWIVTRGHGYLWVSCWGGKHTLKRPQDLYSVLTVRDLRTGQTAVVDCRSPQGLNWTHEVPVLKIRRRDAIEVWKTPTKPVVAMQASASWSAA